MSYKTSVILFAASVMASYEPSLTRLAFDSWAREHGRNYSSKREYEVRLENFKASLEQIEILNRRNAGTAGGATFGVNKYADWSREELRSRLGFRTPSEDLLNSMGPRVHPAGVGAPESVDWREHPFQVVAPIQDQASCGSCWAFSSITNLESRIALQKKESLTKLSEQQLVDCDHVCGKYRDFNGCDAGCNGGLMPNAWTYLRDNQVKTSAEYKYTARDGSCKASDRADGFVTGFEMLTTNEKELMEVIATQGPVAIAVDASQWSFYRGGIMTNTCTRTSFYDLNHAVAIVGYGTSADGVDYWIVRNSWGTSWGDNGYVKVIRDKNQCGVALFACSATLKN